MFYCYQYEVLKSFENDKQQMSKLIKKINFYNVDWIVEKSVFIENYNFHNVITSTFNKKNIV